MVVNTQGRSASCHRDSSKLPGFHGCSSAATPGLSTCLDRGHEELYDEHRAWIMEPSEVIHMPEQRGNRTSGFHARDNANNRIVMPVHLEEKCSKNRLSMAEP